MRLIDNYLSAVASHLRGKDRDDIAAELRSSLYEQLEEQRAALHRDLTEDEQAAFLKKIGHPLKVAGEYAPRRFLIGPALYPYYIQTLRVVVAAVCLLHVVASVVVAVALGDFGILTVDTLTGMVGSVLAMGAFVTIGFAVMEGSGRTVPWIEHWNPLSLRHAGPSHPVDRGDLITNIAIESVILLWWNGVLVLPARIVWDGVGVTLARSGSWDLVFWPVNAVLAGSLALCAAILWIGRWRRTSVALRLLVEASTAAIVIYLLRAPVLLLLEGAAGGELETVRAWVESSVRWTLWMVLAVVLWELITYGRMAARLTRGVAEPSKGGASTG